MRVGELWNPWACSTTTTLHLEMSSSWCKEKNIRILQTNLKCSISMVSYITGNMWKGYAERQSLPEALPSKNLLRNSNRISQSRSIWCSHQGCFPLNCKILVDKIHRNVLEHSACRSTLHLPVNIILVFILY